MSSKRATSLLKLGIFIAALLAVCLILRAQPNEIKVFQFSKLGTTVTDTYFVSRTTDIVITAPKDAKVYYTTDGSTPDNDSQQYTKPIVLDPWKEEFPNCLLLKAVAYYADGSCSEVLTHTFFAHTQIEERYQVLLLSISGDPAQLTQEPDGVLYGENVWLRGAESEREVYIEAISAGGKSVFRQSAGARPYGGVSRSAAIKSLKIFARREYDDNHGKFNIDLFGTVGADNQVIAEYDKLVIRNSANDLYNGFIRDELNQRLAAQAGYTDYQEVLPAVVYLNGEYYGYFWLHENYCDDFLQEKYGKGQGYFEVVEYAEQEKTVDETDPANAAAAKEYNDTYNTLAYSDLTVDENYAKVCEFIDVEQYLQNYAFNVYLNNTDWPHNNNKCYRYYAADGEVYTEGNMDGRWRLLYHDIDYTLGIYGQDRSSAAYDNLQELLTEGHKRYSPLFANLMKREDCRNYFLEEIIRLKDGVLCAQNVIETLDQMYAQCAYEIACCYKAWYGADGTPVEEMAGYQIHLESLELIRQFVHERPGYIEADLIEVFGLPENYFD